MKILFHNLGYGRGHDGSLSDLRRKSPRFLYQNIPSQVQVLESVLALIAKEQPDLFTYAEISTGSFRNNYFDQHGHVVKELQRTTAHSAVCKYGTRVWKRTPFLAGNSNGVISFCSEDIKHHYLSQGRKKLVYEITVNTPTGPLTVFTVHLPLVPKSRKAQLLQLAKLVNERPGDVVVCGDFNIFTGLDELTLLTKQTSLQVAGEQVLTFPAHKPRFQLDVFLYRFSDTAIRPQCSVIETTISDHLPIVLEW